MYWQVQLPLYPDRTIMEYVSSCFQDVAGLPNVHPHSYFTIEHCMNFFHMTREEACNWLLEHDSIHAIEICNIIYIHPFAFIEEVYKTDKPTYRLERKLRQREIN